MTTDKNNEQRKEAGKEENPYSLELNDAELEFIEDMLFLVRDIIAAPQTKRHIRDIYRGLVEKVKTMKQNRRIILV